VLAKEVEVVVIEAVQYPGGKLPHEPQQAPVPGYL
jgi:hypothetical protein